MFFRHPTCKVLYSRILFAVLVIGLICSSIPFITATPSTPQLQWSRTYGPYSGYNIIHTNDGGYAIAGVNATYGDRGYDNFFPLIIKLDVSGEIQWAKTYAEEFGVGGAAKSVVQTTDSGYLLCGDGGWLLKLDANGNVQWNKTYGSSVRHSVAIQANDDGFVLAGWMPTNNNLYNTLLVKTDQNGVILWNKTISADSSDVYVYALIEGNDGGYVLTGQWKNGYFWLVKTDSEGNLLVNRTYNVSNVASYSQSVASTNDGGYILAGGDGFRAWLVKVDSNGEMQWAESYTDEYMNGIFRSVTQTTDGGYTAIGLFGNSDSWLIKTDSFGNAEWVKKWNDTFPNLTGSKIALSLTLTNDKGYAITGELNNEIWLAKFAPEPIASPSPTIPEFPALLVLMVSIIFATSIILFLRKKNI